MTSLATTNLHMVRKPGQLQVAQPSASRLHDSWSAGQLLHVMPDSQARFWQCGPL